MTLTKIDLTNSLSEELHLTRKVAKEIIDTVFEEILNSLARGEEVKIPGLGKFELRDKSQRPGRNPKTGEPAAIKARRVVTFKSSLALKQNIPLE